MTFEEFFVEWGNSENFIIAHTSGSTGQPKDIKLSKDFLIESAFRTIDFFGLRAGDRLHSCVGADFIGGKMMAVRALMAEGKFSWEVPSNQPLKRLDKHDVIDLLAVVPSQMIYIIENLDKMPKIDNIIIGGSSINQDLRKKIANSGLKAYETYGMTETASHIALRRVSSSPSPFVLLPNIKISLSPDNCLRISFENGLSIQTNDIAELVSEREFYIKGRKDNIIISGGRKINPLEIEDKLLPFIKSDFLITGFPDEKWGEKLVIIIEKGKNGANKNVSDLSEIFQQALLPWEKPKEIYFTEQLPKTPNGKTIRIKNPLQLV